MISSRMSERIGMDKLAFDRLRFGNALGPKGVSRGAGDYGSSATTEYTSRPAGVGVNLTRGGERTRDGWERLTEDLLFALEKIAPGVALRINADALRGASPDERGEAFASVHRWLVAHPEVQSKHPVLRFAALLPETLGAAMLSGDTAFGRSPLEISPWEQFALSLSAGSIPRLSEFIQHIRYVAAGKTLDSYGASHGVVTKRSDILPTLSLIRAAMDMHLPRWRATQDSRDVQTLERGMRDLEWFFSNPLTNTDEQAAFGRLFADLETFSAFLPSPTSGRSVAAWPVLFHELWFTPDRLREQWLASGDCKEIMNSKELNEDNALHEDLYALVTGGEKTEQIASWSFQGFVKEGGLVDLDWREYEQETGKTREELSKREKLIPEGKTHLAVEQRILQWYWDRAIIPARQALERIVQRPATDQTALRMHDGFYKSFITYLRLLETGGGAKEMAAYLDGLAPAFTDTAEVNRSQDLMNAYVMKEMGKLERREWEERKRRFVEESKEFRATRDLYVFSDMVRGSKATISLSEPSFNARLIPVLLNPEIARIAENAIAGKGTEDDLGRYAANVERWMPDAHLFRDFFLENASHMALFEKLRALFSDERLRADGVTLEITFVDLRDHLTGHDDQVLDRAYMVTYPLVRVRGLEQATRRYTSDEKKVVADFLTDQSRKMTRATSELFERMAVELEIDHLRADYASMREHGEPRHLPLSAERRRTAGQKAFDRVLEHVLARFPRATQHRDSILRSLMTDLATTSEQVQSLERLTYSYYVRHPGEQTDDATAFSATETVKNYLAMFQDRSMRRNVLIWFFNGPIPDDRLIEGETFRVNEQEKVEAFWLLSSEERRAIFYTALLGEGGLFDCPTFRSGEVHWGEYGKQQMLGFVRDFYKYNFTGLSGSAELERGFEIAFVEAFTLYSPARRVELFLSMTDRMRELRLRGERLSAGQAIRLLLEQVGAVGIKAGQVASEQKDALPSAVRDDLSSLKDGAEPFNKQGVFTYARLAGWYEPGEGRPAISEIGELVGSASIKQVHRARLENGEEVALKVQRPRLERNFEEDMQVLSGVVGALQAGRFDVPTWLLPEVRRVVVEEMDFGREAQSARTMGASLARRSAGVLVGGKELPLSVPKILALHTKETDPSRRMQLMTEEFAEGLTLEDIRRLQARTDGLQTEALKEGREQVERKLRRLYGDLAPVLERRYAEIDLEAVQAQIAIELLSQIADDTLFHADLHRGNVIVNLTPGNEGVSLIDVGSAGNSHPEFLELSAHLLLLKQGIGDASRVADILSVYAPSSLTRAEWTQLVEGAVSESETMEETFKEILARLLKATNGSIQPDARYLLKALASAGGHLQALRERLMRTFAEAAVHAQTTGESPQTVLLRSPEVQKMLPILPRLPFLASLLGA